MKKYFAKFVSILLAVSGFSVLIYVMYPIISYKIESRTKFNQLLNPMVVEGSAYVNSVDYRYASNWFVGGAEKEDFGIPKVSYYLLSIPRLRIKDATVAIGGDDLAKHMIHYPGTALPGRHGNAIIFGHSTLPAFYNPTDYVSIFSTLPTMKQGDAIEINFDGINYLYKIEEMFEVKPTDIEVLAQNKSDSFVTLVTCTPPGDPTKPKRLIVRARLIPFASGDDFN